MLLFGLLAAGMAGLGYYLWIDSGKEQAALDLRWTNGMAVVVSNVNNYIKGLAGTTNTPTCPAGGTYTYNPIGSNPTHGVNRQTERVRSVQRRAEGV